MMKKTNDFPHKLSYESDGVMGKEKIAKKKKKQAGNTFFNNTQNSE